MSHWASSCFSGLLWQHRGRGSSCRTIGFSALPLPMLLRPSFGLTRCNVQPSHLLSGEDSKCDVPLGMDGDISVLMALLSSSCSFRRGKGRTAGSFHRVSSEQEHFYSSLVQGWGSPALRPALLVLFG